MNTKKEYLINLIFEKLKKYKNKKIFLEKENLEKFVLSLLKENPTKKKLLKLLYLKYYYDYKYV